VLAVVTGLLEAGDQRGFMLATAVLLGFFSALQTSTSNHVISSGDVGFHLKYPAQWVSASNLSLKDKRRVDGMSMVLRNAKNDQR
jgi:hypothetical protein